MIRKSGWLILLVVLALVLATVYLFAGFAIRHTMVYALEKTFGAEVNIDNVSLSLAPLTLEVSDLQITDAGQPTHNLVSFDSANAAFSVWPALLGYYVIDELTVDGFRYGAARERPGKVYRGEHADAEESFDLTDTLRLDLPDLDELIARIDLQTHAKGQALADQAKTQQQALQKMADRLPDASTLDRLEAEIKAVTDSKIENAADLAAKAEQLKTLKQSVQAERERLAEVKNGLAQSRETLEQAVADLRRANAEDWQKIQDIAHLDGAGLASLTQILLGDFWGEKVAQVQALYQLVQPYLPDTDKDTAAQLEEQRVIPDRILPLPRKPYPNFWLKQVRVNWHLAGGEATFQLTDVTREHQIIGSPTRLNLDIEQLPRLAAFKLQGEFAILGQMTTALDWQLTGYDLDSLGFGNSNIALTLNDALINSTGSFKLVNSELNQQAEVRLVQPEFAPSGNEYLDKMVNLLNDQSEIPLTLSARGDISGPDLSVRSPLDQLLGDALLGEGKEKLAQWQRDAKAELAQTLERELKGRDQWRELLDTEDASAAAIEERISAMLATKLGDLKSSTEERVKDSLKERLKL